VVVEVSGRPLNMGFSFFDTHQLYGDGEGARYSAEWLVSFFVEKMNSKWRYLS
jgi:aryl-alcohol dehydrogenase-like predicted oxidoreductase